jgi:hypothetical protein
MRLLEHDIGNERALFLVAELSATGMMGAGGRLRASKPRRRTRRPRPRVGEVECDEVALDRHEQRSSQVAR